MNILKLLVTGTAYIAWAGITIHAQLQGESQTGQGQNPGTNVSSIEMYSGITRNPWFNDRSVQQQLRLNNDQLGRLRSTYQQSWDLYQKELNGLPNNLREEQKALQRKQLAQAFNKEFSGALDQELLDQAQRQNFNRLWLQYQGPNVFDDPTVLQLLNHTPALTVPD